LGLRQPHRLAVDPDIDLKLPARRHVDGIVRRAATAVPGIVLAVLMASI
jgi:hypothetical protein